MSHTSITCNLLFSFTIAMADFPHVIHTELDVPRAGQDTEGDEVVGPVPLRVPGPRSGVACGCSVHVGRSVPISLCLILASWLFPPIWVPLMCPRMGSTRGEVVLGCTPRATGCHPSYHTGVSSTCCSHHGLGGGHYVHGGSPSISPLATKDGPKETFYTPPADCA